MELREGAAQAVNHAYGTTGLITALEMPLAPAWHWIDMIVAFPTFMDAVRFGHEVGTGGRNREEAGIGRCVADTGCVPAGARTLPGRTGGADRDGRRNIGRGLQVRAGSAS